MSKPEIVYNEERLFQFILSRIEGLQRTEDMVTMGLTRGGEVTAVAAYEGFNGQNMWVHSAVDDTGVRLTRDFVRACFIYPFDVCKVQRLSGYVNESNAAARRLNEHFGYKEEARLKAAAPDGSDVIVYVMWREDCRYVRH